MTKKKYGTRHYIHTYIYLAHDVMFKKISEKKGIKKFGERAVAVMFKEYQKLDDKPMPVNPFFGPINNE